ncbi:MAG TPA: branched-chain amino acid ABC transporter substrate-binding protein [Jatrophihabitantaceae bacterium]|nr:branched-chain amino acid ABC transporter substrate-binding protein [Jatrophihabitantaceae bacterium]
MHKSMIIKVAVVGVGGAMALAACSSSKSTGGGLSGGSTSPGSSTCSATQTYKIGYQGALSGDNKQLGINEVNAVNLAVDQANATGKLCFKLSVLQSDDGGTTTGAPPAAAALIQDPAVVGVVGPAFTGPTQATGKAYAAAGVALISPSATNATLTSQGFTTFHRIVPTDGVEGKATADFLATKFKTVYVLDDTSPYGAGVAQVVTAALKAKGVKVDTQSIAPTTDYSAVATKIAASHDQAMYYGGYDAQAGLLAKALQAAGYKGFEISGNGGKSAQFSLVSGAAGNGYYFACGCLDATTAPAAAAFNKAYTAMFNTPPSTYSPEAYDAANAMIAAISAAQKAGPVTRASVETAVNALDYQGITTTVKFQPNGEVAQATVNLYEQKNGTIVLLGDITKQ